MAAATDAGYDIFVSCALGRHAISGDYSRRVHALVDALRERLQSILRREIRLFFDASPNRDELRIYSADAGKILQSDTMLILGSPGWLESRWAEPETNSFLAKRDASRLFLAEMIPLAQNARYPFVVDDRNRFTFGDTEAPPSLRRWIPPTRSSYRRWRDWQRRSHRC